MQSNRSLTVVEIESLESRLQYAGNFAAHINFGPVNTPAVRGYKLDYGVSYEHHKNGLTYGWNDDHRSDASYATSSLKNVRAESHINMAIGDSWSIAVPNGYYNVRALMGDPTTLIGDYRLNVEGRLFVNGIPYKGFPFIEGIATVRVTDRQLTFSTDSRGISNRLCSLDITETTAPVPTPTGGQIKWKRGSVKTDKGLVESAVVRLGTTLYIIGGYTSGYDQTTGEVESYDIKTGKWTNLAPIPGPQTHIAAATDGKYIYAAGGQYGPLLSGTLSDQVYRYDIAKNRWSTFSKLPAVHAAGQLVYAGGVLHYLGGVDVTRVKSQRTHWVFDLANPKSGWTNAVPLPTAVDHQGAIVVNGSIYVVGGDFDHGTSYFSQSSLYRFSVRKNRWITLAGLPVGTSHLEASTLSDGQRIFVVGGQVNAQELTANVYSYDIAQNSWSQLTPMPTARKGGIAWLSGNQLFYLAGDDATYGQQPWSYQGVIS